MTPYYADEAVTIYHGDFRALADVRADLVLADPPYGQTSLAWDTWPTGWPEAVGGGSMWVFGTLRSFMDHAAEFTTGRWRLSQDVVWEKQNGSGFMVDRFRRVHEQVAHFYRGDWGSVWRSPLYTADATAWTVRRKSRPPHTGHIEAVPYLSEDGGPRLMRSVLRVRNMHGTAENETQKPVGLLTPLIEYGCPPDGLVFDPFMGSGSTLVAAKAAGRRAVGIELREDQCEIAARRCSQGVLGLAG